MRLIAIISRSADIRHILDHIGVAPELPHIAPARGPRPWDDCDAPTGEGIEVKPDWDLAAQPPPITRLISESVGYRQNRRLRIAAVGSAPGKRRAAHDPRHVTLIVILAGGAAMVCSRWFAGASKVRCLAPSGWDALSAIWRTAKIHLNVQS